MQKTNNISTKYISKGAIHIHSDLSDGTGNIDSISKAAHKAGLDWIIITDHNNFDIQEGIYNDVCVIKGEEISPEKKNHYLALGIDSYIPPTNNPQEYIKEVKLKNGFGFAAHPHESFNRPNKNQPIRWTDETNIPDGIEIWNWFSLWADNLCDKTIFHLAYAFLFKNNLVTHAPIETINWWDKLNNNSSQIVPAIGGVDAHALKINKYIIPVTIFSYQFMFKTITNIIWSDTEFSTNFIEKKQQILTAIKQGKNIILNQQVASYIPLINITNQHQTATCGESIKLDNNSILKVKNKEKVYTKVYLNGEIIYQSFAKNCCLFLNRVGKYRVVVSKNKKDFAYSNPIIVY